MSERLLDQLGAPALVELTPFIAGAKMVSRTHRLLDQAGYLGRLGIAARRTCGRAVGHAVDLTGGSRVAVDSLRAQEVVS
jgi:hypothetical protein